MFCIVVFLWPSMTDDLEHGLFYCLFLVRKERTKSPYTLFYNDEPKYNKYLRSFGEMAVIAISDGKKMRSKLDTRGKTGIFVGYADDHAGNVYRFINIQMKKIILSKDIQWLNSFWKEYKKRKGDSRI